MKKGMMGGTTKTGTKSTQMSSSYTRVGNNIYFDGYSYRVRMSVDGVRYSRSFTNKKKAQAYRKELLGTRVA